MMPIRQLASLLFTTNAYVLPHTDQSGTTQINLTEVAKESKIEKIEMKGVPLNCVAIKLDHFNPDKKFFLGKSDELQRCDYVLIFELNDRYYEYFIEIKSSSKNIKRRVTTQFKASGCLWHYCKLLGRSFHSSVSLPEKITTRYLLFKHKNADKRTTGYKPISWSNNSFEDYATHTISSSKSKINFSILTGKL
jgi:hypothetical protein